MMRKVGELVRCTVAGEFVFLYPELKGGTVKPQHTLPRWQRGETAVVLQYDVYGTIGHVRLLLPSGAIGWCSNMFAEPVR